MIPIAYSCNNLYDCTKQPIEIRMSNVKRVGVYFADRLTRAAGGGDPPLEIEPFSAQAELQRSTYSISIPAISV